MSLIKLADKVEEAYAIISAKNPKGGVRPRDIVEYAKPEDSPLHDHFNWDDHAAGDRYRIWQASQLLSHISIQVDEVKSGKMYRSLPISESNFTNRRYYDIDTIIKTPKLREQVKRQIVRDVHAMIIRYSSEKEIYRLINEPELKKLEAEVADKGISE